MASKKGMRTRGLRLATERKDSESYLLSPELSSPIQFPLSPAQTLPHSGGRNSPRGNPYFTMQDNSWHNSSIGSTAPLIPQNMTPKGFSQLRGHHGIQHNERSGIKSTCNFLYGMLCFWCLRAACL